MSVSMFARNVLGLVFAATASWAVAAPVFGQGTWQTTLQARDLDGNGSTDAYYDTALNITWLADAGAFKGSWGAAKAWTDNLVVGAYSDWRLPTMVDVGNDGCATFTTAGGAGTDCGYNLDASLSEFVHMYQVTLGNKGWYVPGTGAGGQFGWGLSNTGPFSNFQLYIYWLGVESVPNAGNAWYFGPAAGGQGTIGKGNEFYAWAVRPGDVSAVPEPEAWALALSGLAIAGLATRRKS